MLLSVVVEIKKALLYNKKEFNYKSKKFKIDLYIINFLYNKGYILYYSYNKNTKVFFIKFNYLNSKTPCLSLINSLYKKNNELYLTYNELCTLKEPMCILILSTNKGLLPHYEAIKYGIGGKALVLIR